VTDEYAFDAFGGARSSTGGTTNSQQYKGQLLGYRRDPHAGPDTDYSTHHRNYNPKTGRFRSEDPAADDLNLYRYVNNNPVNQADPSGLEAGSDIYTGPIEIFEVAEEKWGVPGGVSRQTHNIQLDEYLLVPTFLKDANGQFTILSHYVAVREVAVRVRNGPDGLEMKPRFEWIVPKTRLREFSEKEERFAGAAAVAFGLRFELLESQRRLLMGDATGTIKHQLIEQWTDPANYFTAFATAAHALPCPAPTLAPRGSPLKNQMGDPVKAAGSARSDPVYGWGRNRNVTPKAPKSTVSTTAPAQIVGPKSAIDPQLDNNLLSQLVNPAHPNHAAAVAYAEANKAAGLSVNRAAYKEFLQHFSKDQFSVLREQYGIKLIREISLDELNSVAQRLRKAFDGSGRDIGEGDAKVAASALLRGEKLATNDLQFFKRAKDLGLNVEYVGSGNAAANAAKYVPQPVTIP
jgi:RHS repeat-associated protein